MLTAVRLFAVVPVNLDSFLVRDGLDPTGKKDEMRTKEDDLSQNAIEYRMKDIVKIRDKKYGYKVMMPMPENGKITAVSSAMTLFSIFSFSLFSLGVLTNFLPPCR